jgi:hypothetical protein
MTQKTIANNIGRSERTVQRRLSNKNRERWGVDPLTRRRVIQEFDDHIAAAVQYHLQADLRSNFGVILIGDRFVRVGVLKIGKEKPKAYRFCTNIYGTSFDLIRSRVLRRRVARHKRDNLATH